MLLALITAALAETITCEAIEGPALRYTYYSKSGGNMPREDTLMEQEIWTLGERTLLVMERTYGGLTTRRGGLDWRWDSGATVIEGIVGGRLNRVITYTQGPRAPPAHSPRPRARARGISKKLERAA